MRSWAYTVAIVLRWVKMFEYEGWNMPVINDWGMTGVSVYLQGCDFYSVQKQNK